MSAPELSRRHLLQSSAALAALAALGRDAAAGQPPTTSPLASSTAAAPPRRALRFAHLTDMHIQPELAADQGVAACLQHIGQLSDRPELIVTGGDLVMDSFETPADRVGMLWDLFTSIFRQHAPVPVRHTLGNHDAFGWNKAKSKTTGSEPRWGKNWACEVLGIPKPNYSFDQAGWHFVILDSVRPAGATGYMAKIDPEQMDWLRSDLAATKLPTVVVSHIPILTLTVLAREETNKQDKLDLSPGLMHVDCFPLHSLFAKSGNVKLVLSGHIHRLDRCAIDNITYICDGAVCGAWWEGPKTRCDEGYGVIDLFADGTFAHQYQTYGWKARV